VNHDRSGCVRAEVDANDRSLALDERDVVGHVLNGLGHLDAAQLTLTREIAFAAAGSAGGTAPLLPIVSTTVSVAPVSQHRLGRFHPFTS
jgi:hypothetical protein